MADESLYLTTYEAALAVVATSMKKARLLIDNLIINSIVAGIVFSAGGMFQLTIQALFSEAFKSNPGLVQIGYALTYPIGLFYVVVLGVDLFNSNILFFSVGVARGAVSLLDLIISWVVSWWFNLVGNIFVCYIISHYSSITQAENYVAASHLLLEEKARYSFVQTMIKGMAGNFLVALAIYLQLMAKPLHVKYFLMALPIFTLVGNGFTHSVADMYILTMGLINKGPVSVATAAWKVFLPGAIGNIIGGSFFGLVIPWYLHIFVVEKDIRLLNLPKFVLRDEQPELNQDSRVVRVKDDNGGELVDVDDEDIDEDNHDLVTNNSSSINEMKSRMKNRRSSESNSSKTEIPGAESALDPLQSMDLEYSAREYRPSISSFSMATSGISRYSEGGRRYMRSRRSPKNVFPVYGMGEPLKREKTIASGTRRNDRRKRKNSVDYINDEFGMDNNDYLCEDDDVNEDEEEGPETIGEKLKKVISRRSIGQRPRPPDDLERRRSSTAASKRLNNSKFLRRIASISTTKNYGNFQKKLEDAGISPRSAEGANEAAGLAQIPYPAPVVTKEHHNGSKSTKTEPSTGSSPALSTPDDSTPADSNSAFKVVNYEPY